MAAEEPSASSQVLPPDVQDTGRGGFRCLLCGVSIPNHPSLIDHLRGRRHTALCVERNRRQQQQEHSVFVSGFSKGTTEEQLKDVFQAISSVKNIVMDKDRGLYAIVEFESQDGVCLALSQTNITLEGQRLKVKPRKKKEFKKKKGGTQRNLQPPDPEALSKLLMRCTDVEDQMKSMVTLCSPSHHESRLRELLLSLLRETFTEFFPGCQLLPFGSSVNGFEISGCDLDLYLELGENDGKEKDDLNRDNEGIEKVDLEVENLEKDVRIEKDQEDSDDLQKDDICSEEEDEIEELMDAGDNENITPGLSLQGLSHEEILNVVERVLRQCVPGVHGVQSVPSARRPVVRFQHKTSGLRGDITLNNRLALRNSSFLRLCSNLDPRVTQLVYTVRYWARMNQLAGNPLGGGPLLNNYALTLLIIFFLQTRSPPVIPSVSQLREMADEAPHMIDGWDCTFSSDPTPVQTDSENQQSLSCLLSEFFSFFSSLELRSNVLCLRDGQVLPLPFSSSPPSWAAGFRFGSLNIQDPFELNHNVCGNVSSRMARRFSSQCTAAAKTCRSPLYHLRSPSRPWGITLILLPPAAGEEKGDGTDISVCIKGASVGNVFVAVKRVLVEVLLCSCEKELGREKAAEKSVGQLDKSKDVAVGESECESEKAVPRLEGLIIGDKVLEITDDNMSEDGKKNESNGRKRENTEEIHSDSKKRRRMEKANRDACANDHNSIVPGQVVCKEEHAAETCTGLSMRVYVWHRVWEGRRKERRSLQGEVAQRIKLETAVSYALSSAKGENKGDKPLIEITVKAQLGSEGNVQLQLTPDADSYGFSTTFFHFLKGFLPSMVKDVLMGED
ncbi:speckle targeted PIP5K1A-regulated poly(A) polymerase isoform X2 [Mixophyes fleayi]|uniref:speckle targeted PIP5K1A-regulated poly(A) polymerase isoform X2 n=1 Tax=Mixophyes fleayi TaxID=3061075 RepID=UPI003F4DBF7A